MSDYKQYIGGELVEGEGDILSVVCPGNEEVAGEVKLATAAQAEQALWAAQEAFQTWSKMPLEERGAWMIRLRDAIEEEQETLLQLLMLETGKLRQDAKDEIANLINTFSFNLETAKNHFDETIRDTSGSCFNLVVREPVGVVVGYLAWNFPLHNLSAKIGPVLASGCTAVFKPSSLTPLSTLYVGEIMHRIGFPKGVINIISGATSVVSEVMTKSKIPAMLCLIGSSRAGAEVIRDSATSIKRFSLELGGNAPFIVTPNAVIDEAVWRCVNSQMYVASQNCTGVQRVFAHVSVYDEFVEKVVRQARDVHCGWGDEAGCNMGPMITDKVVERMQALVDDAVAKGAKVLTGGRKPKKEKGYYYLPTVLVDVTTDMRVFREEVFGPIVSIMKYEEMEEAIRLANDTEYGLTAYVWSHNADEIYKYAQALRFGTISVNGGCDGVHMPHGGIKESGIGKDGGRWALEEYYYYKGIRLHMNL